MKMKLFVISLSLLLGTTMANAQNNNSMTHINNKHDFRLSVSDGTTLGNASFWGKSLSDAINGTKRTDQKSSGVLSFGYRYTLGRFKIGADLGFAKVTSKVYNEKETNPIYKDKELNFMILPTFEYVYFKNNLIELYGSAQAGINFTRNSTKYYAPATAPAGNKSTLTKDFAFQVNPIGFSIGNRHIAGFVEAGLGYKGFVTTGISLKF